MCSELLHRLDPRVKIVALLGFTALVSTLSAIPLLCLGIAFLGSLLFLAGIGGRGLLKRLVWAAGISLPLLVFLPLVTPGPVGVVWRVGPFLVTYSLAGAKLVAVMAARLVNAILALYLLTETTPLRELMLGFKRLYVPPLVVTLVEFTIRYSSVFSAELKRMLLARRARGFTGGRSLLDRESFYTLSQLVGSLLLRSWARSERIYLAMLARGFSSEALKFREREPARMRKYDLALGALILAFALALRLLEVGVIRWKGLSL